MNTAVVQSIHHSSAQPIGAAVHHSYGLVMIFAASRKRSNRSKAFQEVFQL
jgi:hypothetical protein